MTCFFTPNWPAPDNVKSISTLRKGGLSKAPYSSLNLATHVADDPNHVAQNRDIIIDKAKLPESPRWLNQIHSTTVIDTLHWQPHINADGIFSHTVNHVCTVMTADCLPILMCDRQGQFVAAIHAGWRGLANGIIESTIHHYNRANSELLVWLGPAIGPTQFEVGTDVYTHFTQQTADAKEAFIQTDQHHYLANIYLLASQRLNQLGITAIYGGDYCTVSEPEHFFSYRRDSITGRMASMIWLTAK